MPRVDAYLKKVAELDGSDLHLTSNVPPKARVHGKLVAMTDKVVEPELLKEMFYEILDERRAKGPREGRDRPAAGGGGLRSDRVEEVTEPASFS